MEDAPAAGAPGRESRAGHFGRMAALVAVTLGIYAQTATFDFVNFDDTIYVTNNAMVQRGLTGESLAYAFSTEPAPITNPLALVSHMMDVELFGLQAGAHHLTNVLLHGLNAVLLYGVIVLLTGRSNRAWVIAAIFAVHPMHVESVAWISGRKDVLCGLFWLLSIVSYVRHVRAPGRGWLSLSVACFFLSLLAKPMAVTLPFVLLLLDGWPLKRLDGVERAARGFTQLITEKWAFWGLTVAGCAVTWYLQDVGGATRTIEAFPIDLRIGNAFLSSGMYVYGFFVPIELCIYYPHPGASLNWAMAGFSAAVLVVISFATVAAIRRAPYAFVGWFWFLGMLVPIIGIVQVGSQAYADRYTYLPFIGLSIAVVWLISELCTRRPVGAVFGKAVAGAFVALLSVLCYGQVGTWKNTESLYRHALTVAPDNPTVLGNLGAYLLEHGKDSEGVELLHQALALNPDLVAAHIDLAAHYLAVDDVQSALGHVERAATLAPDSGAPYSNLAAYFLEQGELDAAGAAIHRALEADPQFATAHFNRGRLAMLRDDIEGAIEAFETAIHNKPNLVAAHAELARSFLAAGDPTSAERAARAALVYEPLNPEALGNLGVALTRMQRIPEAIECLETAATESPDNFDILMNLGNAYARVKRWEEALSRFEDAAAVQPEHPVLNYNMGLAYELQGDVENALKFYARAGNTGDAQERAAALRER